VENPQGSDLVSFCSYIVGEPQSDGGAESRRPRRIDVDPVAFVEEVYQHNG
jgi:hypothetical protein